MKRITGIGLALALTLGPAPALAQEQGPPTGGRGRMEAAQERRAQLEQEVRERFLAQVERRLGLTADQSGRLRALLKEGAGERRALAEENGELRRALMAAVRDDDTPLSTYQELLERIRSLRAREQALEDREAQALGQFLDARQQALFLMMRMQLNERIRRMQMGRPGRGPGPGPGGGPGLMF